MEVKANGQVLLSDGSNPNTMDTVLLRLMPYLTEEIYKRDEEIDLSDHGNSLYYVREGKVEVSYEENGARIIVAIIGEGEFFGEIGFIDGISRIRNIKASRDCRLFRLKRERFIRLKYEDPILFGDLFHLIGLSICKRFRQVVSESRPLSGYCAFLSSGRVPLFNKVRKVPENLFSTPIWSKVSDQVEYFKSAMYEISNEIQSCSPECVFETCYPKVKALIDDFDKYIEGLSSQDGEDSELMEYVWGYIFKEIFPYFMRSRFAQRAYFKPKGYAGDFLMMEAIYRNKPEGDGQLGLLVDRYCLDTPPARAVRERRRLLSKLIEEEVKTRLGQGARKVKIMNLACGSNRELFDFLKRFSNTRAVEALCMDADKDALTYTNKKVDVFPHEAKIMLMQENVIKWSLRRTKHDFERQDIIYSAGLTDYLDEKLFTALVKRAREYLKPGGVLILSNFSKTNPNKAWMDHILQWKLIHRDEEEMRCLFRSGGFAEAPNTLHEKEGVNLFAIGRKEDA